MLPSKREESANIEEKGIFWYNISGFLIITNLFGRITYEYR